MDELEQLDPLDRQLRDTAPYIDDNGFTARVLAQLPAPHRERFSLRVTILLGITMLSCFLAYVLSGGGRFVTTDIEKVMSVPMQWLLAVALVSGVLVTTGGIFAAVFTTRQASFR